MTKQEFLTQLQSGLADLTESDAQERINFYSEMIDDRMEEGLSEQDAVAQIGDVQTVIQTILAEIPQRAQVVITGQETHEPDADAPKKREKRMETWQILLLILGFPLWLPLLIAAFAVVLSLLAALWSVVVTLWGGLFGGLAGVGLGCTVLGIGCMIAGEWFTGLAVLGAGMCCAGLAIFSLFGCIYTTKGAAWLTGMTFVGIGKLFKGRRQTK